MMTIKEKLNQIYLAARAATLNADQHGALQQYAKDIFEAIEELDETSSAEPKE